MQYIKAKFENSKRSYTYRTEDSVKPGDIVSVRFGNESVRFKIISTPDVAGKADASELYEVLND